MALFAELKALEEFLDFEEKIRREFPQNQVDGLIEELIRFLQLRAYNLNTSPSFIIDQAWHVCLLFPVLYFEICGILLRDNEKYANSVKIINHQPLAGDNITRQKHRYLNTLKQYRNKFGIEPPVAFWPPGDNEPQDSDGSAMIIGSKRKKSNEEEVKSYSNSNHETKSSERIEDRSETKVPNEEPCEEDREINLTLRNQRDYTINFKVKPSTRLGSICKSYAKKTGESLESLSFYHDGDYLGGDCSVQAWGIENGDCIYVSYKQSGC